MDEVRARTRHTLFEEFAYNRKLNGLAGRRERGKFFDPNAKFSNDINCALLSPQSLACKLHFDRGDEQLAQPKRMFRNAISREFLPASSIQIVELTRKFMDSTRTHTPCKHITYTYRHRYSLAVAIINLSTCIMDNDIIFIYLPRYVFNLPKRITEIHTPLPTINYREKRKHVGRYMCVELEPS